MNKALLYCLGYILSISVIAFFILSGTDTEGVRYKVSGWDAFDIALSRPWYWVCIIAGLIIVVLAIIKANKMIKEEDSSGGVHALLGLAALIFVATIFKAPSSIKADPIGSGATTEQIKYLDSKGMR